MPRPPSHAGVDAAAQRLRLMAFDVDGVMTDGGLIFDHDGRELKTFNTLDGHGLKQLAGHGVVLAIITGRTSGAVAHRARNLGIEHLYQGVHDKRAVLRQLAAALGIDPADAGYMGDDVVDLPVMRACGFSAAPANAHPFVRTHAAYLCQRPGGAGAVREVCDYVLTAQGALDAIHATYLKDG